MKQINRVFHSCLPAIKIAVGCLLALVIFFIGMQFGEARGHSNALTEAKQNLKDDIHYYVKVTRCALVLYAAKAAKPLLAEDDGLAFRNRAGVGSLCITHHHGLRFYDLWDRITASIKDRQNFLDERRKFPATDFYHWSPLSTMDRIRERTPRPDYLDKDIDHVESFDDLQKIWRRFIRHKEVVFDRNIDRMGQKVGRSYKHTDETLGKMNIAWMKKNRWWEISNTYWPIEGLESLKPNRGNSQ